MDDTTDPGEVINDLSRLLSDAGRRLSRCEAADLSVLSPAMRAAWKEELTALADRIKALTERL
jgi:hypothetical protein